MHNRTTWLAELKAGDEVAIRNSNWLRTVQIHKIDRVTKTLIFCGQHKFNVSRGYTPGGGFIRSSIWPVTDDLSTDARFQELSHWLRSLTPTIQQLEAMKKAYDDTRTNPAT
jgi:hypothetical protein